MLVGALTFFPALLLGPVVQGLTDQPLLDDARKDLITAALAIVAASPSCSASPTRSSMTGDRAGRVPGARPTARRSGSDGKVVGSQLIGSAAVSTPARRTPTATPITEPDPTYFQPRPSATGYSATATYFANRGPNQAVGARLLPRRSSPPTSRSSGPTTPA